MLALVILVAIGWQIRPWNDPYPVQDDYANNYYASFAESPKTLDPARSYSVDEAIFTSQIYEPPLQYHYLKRPYTLVPLTATEVPQPSFLDKQGKLLPANAPPESVAYSVYTIHIQPGIFYQPHPAFAKKNDGNYYYHHLTDDEISEIYSLDDLPKAGTRELIADDYVYEIKRLADPRVQSPIYGFLNNYILGLPEFNAQLIKVRAKQSDVERKRFLDLRKYDLSGVKVIDKYTYSITIKGLYPQFIYWLAMPFFAPMPWEADAFYLQPGMTETDLSIDWYPIGTGPYYLAENNPNRQMVLLRNPKFHGERYPTEGEPQDKALGLLNRAGQPLPFIDKFIFTLEKESIPRWTKFLQGYYDQSSISSDSFDQAIHIDPNGNPEVAPSLQEKAIRLQTSIGTSIDYFGFNMLDPVVGGYSDRARKLRLAIAMALDTQEFIAIFLNGRGLPAQGPIPPGIFGYHPGSDGINSYMYHWTAGRLERNSLDEAKRLLAEAGYPNGRDPKTGEPLLLSFDVTSGGSGDDKALFAWLRKQFAKLNIELQVRDTQYNRFQEKVRTGQAQIFSWGWLADYPDPENFLFLLYGPNGKVKFDGENATNYQNPEFDALFVKMRNLANGPERQAIIDRMVEIVRHDSPWVWGYHPQTFMLSQSWLRSTKPNAIANNTLKYMSVTPKIRAEKRQLWNQPVLWPLLIPLLIVLISLLPLFFHHRRRRTPL